MDIGDIITFILMAFMSILVLYVAIKLTIKRFRKPKNLIGTVVSKHYSKADDFDATKGFMNEKVLYSVKIKCDIGVQLFKTSKVMYELLESNQKICFSYNGDILYDFDVIE